MVERNKAASRRLYEEVFGRGSLDVADEILAEDCLNHGPGSVTVAGTGQIKAQAHVLRTAIPDLRLELKDQFVVGDRVCSRWSGSGTHRGDMRTQAGTVPPTGNRIAFDEIRIDRHADGRITESWFMPDRLTLWQQLGLVPLPPAAH